ncbi:MAG TPA: maleylpyruvate isomerase family mycothiol-dependent enzyme [Acidimicrobiia bacterium]
MDAIIDDLAAQHAELRSLVEACTESDWSRPTPCEGWDVADVLLHLVQTDELAVASARGDLDRFRSGFLGTRDETSLTVDAAAAAQVEVERAIGGAAIAARWERSSANLLAELRAGDPHRRVTWVAGQLSLQTLATTRLAESWIHTGDIAAALGVELAPTNRLRHVTRLAWRTLPYAFAQAGLALSGPVALDLVGPDGDRWHFAPDEPALTTIRGRASEFCALAARRLTPAHTSLVGEGPDAAAVLQLVRTYAQ